MRLPFSGKNAESEDPEKLVRKYLVSVINIPITPPTSPERDTGLGRDNVRQLAEVDAKSGAWDKYGIMSLDSQFPREEEIDHEIERRRQDHLNTLRTGLYNALHLSADAEHQPVTTGGSLTSLAEAKGNLADTREMLDGLEAQREKDVEVVEGRSNDATGTPWAGAVPTPPILGDGRSASIRMALRPERIKQWFLDIGLTLVALVVETIIVKESIAVLVRNEGWWGYLYAIPALVVVIVLPHVIGIRLAYALRRKSFNWQERATLGIAIPMWLMTVFFLAAIRRDATEYKMRLRVAKDLSKKPNEVDPSQIPFNSTQTLWVWAVIIAGVGVSLLVLKLVFYNPYVTRIVKVDTKIAAAQRKLRLAEREFERIKSQVELQNKALITTATTWDHYIDIILPAHALELKAHYRNCLLNAFGSPDMTDALLAVPEGTAYSFAEPPQAEPTDTLSTIAKEYSFTEPLWTEPTDTLSKIARGLA